LPSDVTFTGPPYDYTLYLETISTQGCRDTSERVLVSVTPDFSVNIEPDTADVMRVEESQPGVSLNAVTDLFPDFQPDLVYGWDIKDGEFTGGATPIDQNITADFPEITERFVRVTATYEGCTVSDSILVETYQNTFLNIPNVFTPNGDGLNDEFELDLLGTTYTLVVYDRWGREVFAGNEEDENWNGRIGNNGDHVPEGVYVYVLEYETTRHEGKRSGTVTVLR
ncbi:MAG: gliding motility-associated C-terminal domain-containing protein, partial [Bacteroidota bacterium]